VTDQDKVLSIHPVIAPGDVLARTTGSEGHSGNANCRRCGGQIKGQRRNGFCSDRCRMAARREAEVERKREILEGLKNAVNAVATELLGASSADSAGGSR